MKLNRIFAAAALGMAVLMAAPATQAADPIRVGSKIDTEGSLLGNLILLMLDSKGLPTTDKIGLGPTKIVRSALTSGAIDIYPEYTGNAAFFFDKQSDPAWKDAARAYAEAKALDAKDGIVWLQPAPADNTWAIAVRKDVADKAKLKTLGDFAAWVKGGATVKLAGSAEFVESSAALPAFQKAYGFTLDASQLLVFSGGGTAATEQAAARGTSGVNAAMAFGTDGQLSALGLVVLADDRKVQPVYQPAPIIRKAVLDAHPEIAGLLAPVFKELTRETLQKLNAQIAVEGQPARTVATAWLKQKGFLK